MRPQPSCSWNAAWHRSAGCTIGKLVAYSYSGVDPKLMGIGPVPAVQALLRKTGFTLNDIDVFEVNEAFAAQALAVCRCLELPMDRTNPNGSGIFARPSAGRHRLHFDNQSAVRTETDRWPARSGHHVYRRGQGIAAIFETM